MRRTFADILNAVGVDVAVEYHSFYMLVYEEGGFYADMEECFQWMPFAGTAYDLSDFNERNQLYFERFEYSDDLDDLLLLAEYVYNFACAMNSDQNLVTTRSLSIARHANTLADKIGYRFISDRGLYVLVPVNEGIGAAAEIAPEVIGNDLFRYDYRAYKGDLEGKRKILVGLAAGLEPHREELSKIAKDFTSDYFYMVNNLNIRHNNVEPIDSSKYKEYVALMSDEELEGWYDAVRYMSAAAFLLLEYGVNVEAIKNLKRA